MNILVVDDEIDMAQMLKSAIEMRYSSNVSVAHTGCEGLAHVKNRGADLIVCDLMMPDMNGLEMIRRIRDSNQNVPVIFITAYVDIHGIMEAIRLGAADFIRKPFNVNSLYFSLDRLIYMTEEAHVFTQPLEIPGKAIWDFTTKDCNVAEFASNLANLLVKGHMVPFHERHSFYVVISEALTNAREHGNLNLHSHLKDEDLYAYQNKLEERLTDPVLANKKIRVEFENSDSELTIGISDEGQGFDHSVIDSPEFYNQDSILKLHGKGLLLIKAYMDKVEFNQKGNTIRLIKQKKTDLALGI